MSFSTLDSNHQGFTLIEILIVLIIVALFIGPAIISIDKVSSRRLDSQGLRLKIWLDRVAEEAVLTGALYGVKQEKQSLLPLVLVDNVWQQVSNIPVYEGGKSIEIALQVASNSENGSKAIPDAAQQAIANQNNYQEEKEREEEEEEVSAENEVATETDEDEEEKLIFPDFFFIPLLGVMPKTQIIMQQELQSLSLQWDSLGNITIKQEPSSEQLVSHG